MSDKIVDATAMVTRPSRAEIASLLNDDPPLTCSRTTCLTPETGREHLHRVSTGTPALRDMPNPPDSALPSDIACDVAPTSRRIVCNSLDDYVPRSDTKSYVTSVGNASFSSGISSDRRTSQDEDYEHVNEPHEDDLQRTSEISTLHESATSRTATGSPRKVVNEVQCDECEMLFSNAQAVSRHKKSQHLAHQRSMTVCCPECRVTLVTENLALHLRVHGRDAKYECGECAAKFISRKSRTKHIQVAHGYRSISRRKSGISWMCSYAGCSYSSIRKSNVKRHREIIHLKIRKFGCPFRCGYSASTKCTLQKHVRTCVHGREGGRVR